MNHFFTLKTKRVSKETADAVSIVFEIPADLKEKFRFKQGQYLNLKLNLNGEELRRSYSIVNAPGDANPDLEILVKEMEHGTVSKFLNNELKTGDTLEVQQPMGNFNTIYHSSNQKTYIGLAAGSGISPVLSNLKESLHQEPNAKAYLFFSNRTEATILKRKEIEDLVSKFNGRLTVVYILSREKHKQNDLFEGRISPEKLDQLLNYFPEINPQEATYFLCGPAEMIKNVSDFLKKDKKVPAIQVLYEYFSAPDDEDSAEMSEEFKAIPNLESMVTLIIDDDEYSFHLNSKKKSILDQALNDKLPVPFACKGGVCCTCKAQVMEGEVFMEKNFALTEEEVARGFVLTCQCHPTTNVVMLNYDV